MAEVDTSAAVPAPIVERTTYAAGDYWDKRYLAKSCNFDWFYNYGALRPLLMKYLLAWKHLPCLHVGCGNSNIQEGLMDDGFVEVINTDISPVVIDQMNEQHAKHFPALQHCVSDCRAMPEFKTGYFGAVIDKGTMDAVLCAHNGQQDTFRYLREVNRILVPGGTFLLISLGSPASRLEVFSKAGLNWKVEVILMPKPMLYLKSESSLTGRPISSDNTNDKDDPVNPIGPFQFSTYDSSNIVSTEEQHLLQPQDTAQQHLKSFLMNREKAAAAGVAGTTMMEGIEPKDHFYLYICKKHVEGTSSPQLDFNLAHSLSLSDMAAKSTTASSSPQLELADLSLEETAARVPMVASHTTHAGGEVAGGADVVHDEGEGGGSEAQVVGTEEQESVEGGGAEAASGGDGEPPEPSSQQV